MYLPWKSDMHGSKRATRPHCTYYTNPLTNSLHISMNLPYKSGMRDSKRATRPHTLCGIRAHTSVFATYPPHELTPYQHVFCITNREGAIRTEPHVHAFYVEFVHTHQCSQGVRTHALTPDLSRYSPYKSGRHDSKRATRPHILCGICARTWVFARCPHTRNLLGIRSTLFYHPPLLQTMTLCLVKSGNIVP